MILILDDTHSERYLYNDLSYLKTDEYKSICTVVERPTKKVFRNILSNIDQYSVMFNHRSLKLFNDLGETVDGATDIKNFFMYISEQKIQKIEFGRDTNNSFDVLSLNKSTFYENLKPFLDNYLSSHQIELKILFFGDNYIEVERLTMIDKIFVEIMLSSINDFKDNLVILQGIKLLIPNKEATLVIDEWINKEYTKKEIRQFINELI